MTPDELLTRALEIAPDDPARPVLITAAVAAALKRRVILVGGAAVNLHTGVYRPTDIDLIAHLETVDHPALGRLGFRRQGRHFQLDSPEGPILIEFPDDQLHPLLTSEPETVEVAPGVTVEVVTLDDLMMDRILQATDSTPVTFDEAVRLAVAAYPRINWDDLQRRCTDARHQAPTLAATRLPDTLTAIRRTAKRRLRDANTTTNP
jgi:hypothetical protein